MKKLIISVVVVVLLVGGYFLLQGNSSTQLIDNQPAAVEQPAESNLPQTEIKNEVIYTDSGYSPSELTIKVGDTVNFKNESSSGMWVGSAMHPSHIVYSGTSLQEHCPDTANTSFDQCKSGQPGESWSFTFTKKGTWGYHNHGKAMHFGKVVVESSP